MEKEQEDKFDALFDMFASKGWKAFQADIEEAITLQNDLRNIPNEETLYKAQGRLLTLFQIQNTEDDVKQMYDKLKTDEEDGVNSIVDIADENLE